MYSGSLPPLRSLSAARDRIIQYIPDLFVFCSESHTWEPLGNISCEVTLVEGCDLDCFKFL